MFETADEANCFCSPVDTDDVLEIATETDRVDEDLEYRVASELLSPARKRQLLRAYVKLRHSSSGEHRGKDNVGQAAAFVEGH